MILFLGTINVHAHKKPSTICDPNSHCNPLKHIQMVSLFLVRVGPPEVGLGLWDNPGPSGFLGRAISGRPCLYLLHERAKWKVTFVILLCLRMERYICHLALSIQEWKGKMEGQICLLEPLQLHTVVQAYFLDIRKKTQGVKNSKLKGKTQNSS